MILNYLSFKKHFPFTFKWRAHAYVRACAYVCLCVGALSFTTFFLVI